MRELWTAVWADARFFNKRFHEQSSLHLQLRQLEPGFGSAKPWHEYLGGEPVRTTERTAVLPHRWINSNAGAAEHKKHRRAQADGWALDADAAAEGAQFAFHAVGCSPKRAALVDALRRAGRLWADALPLELIAPGRSMKRLGDAGLAALAPRLAASPFVRAPSRRLPRRDLRGPQQYLGLDQCELTDAAVSVAPVRAARCCG